MKKLKYTDWSEVHEQAWNLGKIVASDFQPNAIVAIARGGLVVSRILADYFSLMRLYAVNIESTGTQVHRVTRPQVYAPASLNLADCSVLVVDEVSNSGYSLHAVECFASDNGARAVKTAVLVYKTSECIIRPDFFAEECDEDVWHTYPWAIAEDLGYIASRDPQIGVLYAERRHSKLQQYLADAYGLIVPERAVWAVLEKTFGDDHRCSGMP